MKWSAVIRTMIALAAVSARASSGSVDATTDSLEKALGPPVRICTREVFTASAQALPATVKEVRLYGGPPGVSRNAFFSDADGQRTVEFMYFETCDLTVDLFAKYLAANDGKLEWKEDLESVLVREGHVRKAWRRADGKAMALYREFKVGDREWRDLVVCRTPVSTAPLAQPSASSK